MLYYGNMTNKKAAIIIIKTTPAHPLFDDSGILDPHLEQYTPFVDSCLHLGHDETVNGVSNNILLSLLSNSFPQLEQYL